MTVNIWTAFAEYKRHQAAIEAASRDGNAFARKIVEQANRANGLVVDTKAAESFARNLRQWIAAKAEQEEQR